MSDAAAVDYAELAARVAAAHEGSNALRITGGGSKHLLLGRRADGEPLSLAGCRGVVSYRPAEMVLTARAGTPVRELAELTAAENQRLPFEALQDSGATLGGTVAAGLSGPARPWRGAVRDAVLGTRLINGRGELLRFGGEVMKNVAGYDVSRLQCGALGTLGVIVEVSVRLLPLSAGELTLSWELSAADAVAAMRTATSRPLPLSGACWVGGKLYLRLEGSANSLAAAREALPANAAVETSPPWQAIREFTLPALREQPLWCLSTAPGAPLDADQLLLVDWAGARRFYRGADTARMQQLAERGHGTARKLWCGDRAEDALMEPPAALRALQERLKAALDPRGILNPGRLYSWL